MIIARACLLHNGISIKLSMKQLSVKKLIIRNIAAVGFIAVMLLAVFLIFFSDGIIVYADTSEFGGGNGTEESPYLISTDEHLQRLSANVQSGGVNGYNGVYFSLESDIDLTDISQGGLAGWMPIGTSLYPFAGTFLGNNRKISGIIINRISDNIGLFGVTSQNSVIKDLTVDGTIRGGMYTGGIVGYNSGYVENTVNLADISTMSASASDTGGIVGHNFKGTLVCNANRGRISNNSFNAGGIAGTNDGTLLQCFNVGEISGSSNVGGVVGANSRDGQITESFNSGKLVAANNFVGGIAGDNKGLIANTYNAGAVTADSSAAAASDYFGGLAGNNDGSNGSNGHIRNSYNLGNVDEVSFFGHISAFNTGIIENCYFNNEDKSGDATNGIYAIHTIGLNIKAMLDADTLTNEHKMNVLNSDGLWSKRESDADFVYFPEISSLSPRQESKDSAKFKRIEKDYDDITLKETEFVYNGETHEMDILLNGVTLIKDLEYKIVSNSINAAGANGSTITIELTNYYKGTITKEFTINQRPITITWTQEQFYYNGSVQHHTAIVETGRIGDEEITFIYEYGSNIDAGKHSVTAKLAETEINGNYAFKASTHEYVIDKSPLTVTWGDDKYIYNGKAQYPKIIIESGKVDGEEIIFEYKFDGCVNAGEYELTALLADNSVNANYFYESQPHTFVIETRELSLRWDAEKLIYNGKAQHPIAYVDGAVENESVELVYLDFENNIDANDRYLVKVSLGKTLINANYHLQKDTERIYAIERSEIKIKWDNSVLRYNAKAQRPIFYVESGQVGNEEIEFEISDFSSNINYGSNYSITVQLAADSAINKNYSFSASIKKYNIEKAQVNIAWGSEILYYNGNVQHPTAKITSIVYDDVNLIYSNYSGRNAYNGYSIDIVIDNNNYEIVNTLTYDILPKNLKAEWDNTLFEYNRVSQCPGYLVIGVLENETVEITVSDHADHVAPGDYEVYIVSNNPNYIFDNTGTCKYQITKREILLDNIIAEDRCYDETVLVELSGGTLLGVLEGDSVSFVLGQGVMQNANAGTNKKVTANITLTGSSANNYVVRQTPVSVNIFLAEIDMEDVSFQSQTFTYDGTPKSIFVEGNLHKSIIVEYENNECVQVGAYQVIAKFILTDSNYEPIDAISATLYIVESKYNFENVVVEISDGYLQYGSKIRVDRFSKNFYDSYLDGYDSQLGFSLSLFLNETEIEPDGTLSIRVTLPKNISNKPLQLYSIKNGTVQAVDFRIDNGEMVFYTTELGDFVIATKENYLWIMAVIVPATVLILIAIIVFLFIRKKSRSVVESSAIARAETVFEGAAADDADSKNFEAQNNFQEIEATNTSFIFDGVYCKNYECFKCALVFRTTEKQIAVCSGDKDIAKLYESIAQNMIYWKGRKIRINSTKYEQFMIAVSEAIKNAQKKY